LGVTEALFRETGEGDIRRMRRLSLFTRGEEKREEVWKARKSAKNGSAKAL
jgi:hypothetical protein